MKKKPRNKRRVDLASRVGVWLGQHAQALVFSIGQMYRNPFSSFMTTCVIGISLALPAAFYLLLSNVQDVMNSWGGSARMTLFLKADVDDAQAETLAAQLRGNAHIEDVIYMSPAQALAEYRRMSGFADALESLDQNPLPGVLLVQSNLSNLSGSGGEALMAELRRLPQVDSGRFDRQWVQRLLALIEILHRGVMVLAAMLAVAVLLIIGNTIRLAIFNRRTEIEVNMLFGATHAFIRRPFLYSGLIHGLGGALLAWLLVSIVIGLLSGPVSRLADLYLSQFALKGLSAREVLWLLFCGAALGLTGSWLSLQRHLREISPA